MCLFCFVLFFLFSISYTIWKYRVHTNGAGITTSHYSPEQSLFLFVLLRRGGGSFHPDDLFCYLWFLCCFHRPLFFSVVTDTQALQLLLGALSDRSTASVDRLPTLYTKAITHHQPTSRPIHTKKKQSKGLGPIDVCASKTYSSTLVTTLPLSIVQIAGNC